MLFPNAGVGNLGHWREHSSFLVAHFLFYQ